MMREYIKKSAKEYSRNKKEHHIHNKVMVHVKDVLPETIDLEYVLKKIESLIPKILLYNIEMMYIGAFDNFKEMQTNALYKDGAIYVTNDQTDEDDMIDDIIHEIAHATEEWANDLIYSDGLIGNELVGKRTRMCDILEAHGYKVPNNLCEDLEYSKEFDIFLYKEVGYPILTSLTMGLFYSPYGATSLREYFANGFEAYFLGDSTYLKNISPQLFNKLEELANYNAYQGETNYEL